MEEFLKPHKKGADVEKRILDKFKKTVGTFNENFIGIHKIKNYSKRMTETTDYLIQNTETLEHLFNDMK
jgi:hypothetical protein